MTGETQLWIGLAAGAVIGTAWTWITIWIGLAIGRRLHRRPPVAAGHWEPEPATGEVWPTLDADLRHLTEREGR